MKTKIITYGTSGYIELLKNFYCNLNKLGIAGSLKIFCLDENAFNQLNIYAKDSDVKMWQGNTPAHMMEYGEAGYHSVMEAKLQIISQELKESDRILYSDADVFFSRNPIQYLGEAILHECGDVLFMLDWNGDACAGFFYARNSKNCRDLFKPSSLDGKKDFDQTLINHRLKIYPIKYSMLDARLFSNGPIWRGGVCGWQEDYYVTHHNAVQPNEKIELMKKHGHWLL